MRAGGLESVEMLNDDDLDIVVGGQGAREAAKGKAVARDEIRDYVVTSYRNLRAVLAPE